MRDLTAADRMIREMLDAWTRTEFEATVEAGSLADPDEEALADFCAETGESLIAASEEVMDFCRKHVAELAAR